MDKLKPCLCGARKMHIEKVIEDKFLPYHVTCSKCSRLWKFKAKTKSQAIKMYNE